MDKTCTKCGDTKPVSEFSPARRGKYGVRGDCKQCVARYVSQYKRRNPELIRERERRYACGETGRLKNERRRERRRQAAVERRRANPLPHQTPYKKCPICGEEKLRATDFYRQNVRYCKPCNNKYQYQRLLARKHEEVG